MWRANVLRFHAPPAGPGFAGQSLLAASLPRLSTCGADVGRRIVRREGIDDAGERLAAHAVQVLRHGQRTAWLEVVLDEGRNRHIRRLLQALGFDVLRLVRVAIGPVQLGTLEKGQWRELEVDELQTLQCPFSE